MRDVESWVPRIARRIRAIVKRESLDAQMDAEMRYHIECDTA